MIKQNVPDIIVENILQFTRVDDMNRIDYSQNAESFNCTVQVSQYKIKSNQQLELTEDFSKQLFALSVHQDTIYLMPKENSSIYQTFTPEYFLNYENTQLEITYNNQTIEKSNAEYFFSFPVNKAPIKTLKGFILSSTQSQVEFLFSDEQIIDNDFTAEFKETKNICQQQVKLSHMKSSLELIQTIKNYSIRKYDQTKYDFLEQIGEGCTSKVFKVCKKNKPDRYYAIKIINKESLQQGLQDVIKNEIYFLRRLEYCPNIVNLHGVYQSEENIYMVLRYMEGGDLLYCRKQMRSFKENQIRLIFSQVLLSLDFMHKRNIVHRDIKPENILIKQKEINSIVYVDVFLADFGFANFQNVCQSTFVKDQGFVCGTLGYFSPETLKRGDHNTKSDMFGAGCLLYFLITGKQLIRGKNEKQLLINNKNCNFPLHYREEIKYCLPQISKDLFDLLKQLLSKNDELRPSAEDSLRHQFFKTISQGVDQSIKLINNNQGDYSSLDVEQVFQNLLNNEELAQKDKAYANQICVTFDKSFIKSGLQKQQAQLAKKRKFLYQEIIKKNQILYLSRISNNSTISRSHSNHGIFQKQHSNNELQEKNCQFFEQNNLKNKKQEEEFLKLFDKSKKNKYLQKIHDLKNQNREQFNYGKDSLKIQNQPYDSSVKRKSLFETYLVRPNPKEYNEQKEPSQQQKIKSSHHISEDFDDDDDDDDFSENLNLTINKLQYQLERNNTLLVEEDKQLSRKNSPKKGRVFMLI